MSAGLQSRPHRTVTTKKKNAIKRSLFQRNDTVKAKWSHWVAMGWRREVGQMKCEATASRFFHIDQLIRLQLKTIDKAAILLMLPVSSLLNTVANATRAVAAASFSTATRFSHVPEAPRDPILASHDRAPVPKLRLIEPHRRDKYRAWLRNSSLTRAPTRSTSVS